MSQKQVWNDLTYTQKLAATAVVFEAVAEHFKNSGSYRFLIYNRLGFDKIEGKLKSRLLIHLEPPGLR